jgi:hypothetical protein
MLAVAGIAGSLEAAENVAHAGEEANAAKDEQENGPGVQPAVEKEA